MKIGNRVRINSAEPNSRLHGKTGTVVSLGDSVGVKMDDNILGWPASTGSFYKESVDVIGFQIGDKVRVIPGKWNDAPHAQFPLEGATGTITELADPRTKLYRVKMDVPTATVIPGNFGLFLGSEIELVEDSVLVSADAPVENESATAPVLNVGDTVRVINYFKYNGRTGAVSSTAAGYGGRYIEVELSSNDSRLFLRDEIELVAEAGQAAGAEPEFNVGDMVRVSSKTGDTWLDQAYGLTGRVTRVHANGQVSIKVQDKDASYSLAMPGKCLTRINNAELWQ